MIKLDFSKNSGLLPVITQDYKTGEVLMLAYMNQEAWEATISSGKATYFSRSRQSLWVKGETSGNLQIVKDIRVDCDEDTVLLKVEQIGGAACHKGYRSCFFRKVEDGSLKIIGKPIFNPDEVYKK
jgi:phosphoribosyl-AMP cyclohydrolase